MQASQEINAKVEFYKFKELVRKVLFVPSDFLPTGQFQTGQIEALRQAYREIFGDVS